jgi:TatD DNase family protein
MTDYIDIGVNLTGSAFAHDLPEVIARARAAGVHRMIVTGTDVEHSQHASALCEQYPGVLYSTAGMHPHHANDFNQNAELIFRQLAELPHVLAIGECGLDYNRNYSSPQAQRKAFETQLAIACELKLPVFLHQRDAHDDFVAMLESYHNDLTDVVVHCFTEGEAIVQEYIEMGFYLGITGWICDERRGGALQQAVKSVPLDRIMLETDAPYLLPRDLSVLPADKRRNEPYLLPHIADVTARYMEIDPQQLAQASLQNAERFFRLV